MAVNINILLCKINFAKIPVSLKHQTTIILFNMDNLTF
jgi:hypothetical protein